MSEKKWFLFYFIYFCFLNFIFHFQINLAQICWLSHIPYRAIDHTCDSRFNIADYISFYNLYMKILGRWWPKFRRQRSWSKNWVVLGLHGSKKQNISHLCYPISRSHICLCLGTGTTWFFIEIMYYSPLAPDLHWLIECADIKKVVYASNLSYF